MKVNSRMADKRLISNSVQLPNAVVDELMANMTGAQLKCYLVVLRLCTNGGAVEIKMDTFLLLTGISKRQTVNAAIDRLVFEGLIQRRQIPGAPTIYRPTLPMPIGVRPEKQGGITVWR